MLGTTTTTFAPIAQFEGELNILYDLPDGCDSLRTYFKYDILWWLHVFLQTTAHTTCQYMHNHASEEFAPV